jgi:hypothetical protein
MTCTSSSFRVSGKCTHVTHSPSVLAHVQIPFMHCLGTLVLDRLASYSTHGIPSTTRIHRGRCDDERRGRRCRNEMGSHTKMKRAGHRAPELRSHFILDAGVIRASHIQGPGNAPLQPRSRTNRLRAILISWCRSVFTFLAHTFALPTHTNGNMPAFLGTGPPYGLRRSLGLWPFPSSAQPGDIFVGFARRRPPRLLCSTPPQEPAAGGRG